MSLRVWLPLTKDLRNQGLDNVTVTNNGATFNSAGKLGGCYSFNGSSYITVQNVVLQNIWSYSCWLYSDISSRGWEVVMACNINGGDADMQLGLYTRPEGNVIQNTANGQYNASIPMTYGQWNHFVGTFDGANLKTYLNGVLVNTKAITNAKLDRPKLTIGARCRGSSCDCYFLGLLNDVRIYDHCLSQMEVKELSKGLVLHYPLNRGGWGQENFLKNSDDLTKWNKESGISVEWDSTEQMYKIFTTTKESSRWGIYQDYAITVDADTHYTFSLTGKTDGFSSYLSFGAGTSWPSNHIAFTGTKQRLSKTITIPAGTTNIRVYLFMYPQTGGGHVYFEKPKLEIGPVPTPWCPNSSDALATTMDLNGTTEYDTSGYCNNGTRSGTFNWTSDTPKYNVSQIFNGTNNAIQTPNLTTMVTDKNYTIACWFYKDSIGSKGYQTIYGGPSGFELEARNGNGSDPQLVAWNWGKPIAPYTFGVWHHFAFVHTDSDCKIYLDGEYVSTGSSITTPSGNYFIGAWRDTSSQNYEGKISDFRIYATALSASDIRSLYQNN